MLLLFGAANRDPRRYPDPDTFNIHRDNISHITFGKGVHYCLGANLARLEGRVALDELLNRWPEWDIDYETARLAPTSTVRGWEELRCLPWCIAGMCKQLHHVVMRSHSAQTFLAFLTDVVGMEVQFQMRVPSQVLEATLGWPPSDGADVTMLGSGAAGLIEVLDVPQHLRDIAPEGLAALSFLTEDFDGTHDRAMTFASDVTRFEAGFPGVELFFCTMGGVPIEFAGGYAPEQNSENSDATNS